MSTCGPLILGRVWIQHPADPSRGRYWSIYNADTGKLFDDVVAMQITVDYYELTVVDLRRINMAGFERYYLVAPPEPNNEVVLNVPCAECSGSGYYQSPVTGKRSPCSLGCKHP